MNSMIKLCLCEDEPNIRKQLRKALNDYEFNREKDFWITELNTPNDLLSENDYDVIFLDIGFDGEHIGIQIANQLRRMGNKSVLVFCTAFPQYAIDGYEAKAFRYIVKPITVEKVTKVMDAIFFEWENDDRYLSVKSIDGDTLLSCTKITTIESIRRRRVVHYSGKDIITWESLKDIYAKLPQSRFVYVSRSEIVNLGQVLQMTTKGPKMSDGRMVILSRRHKDAFLDSRYRFIEKTQGR